VSKATGRPLAKIAARCMAGETLAEQGTTRERVPHYWAVKEAIFPFLKFQNVDPILGPEMRSTGEVMGVGKSFGEAFARGHEAAHIAAPAAGSKVFLSVRDADKPRLLEVARDLARRGFALIATGGTCAYLRERGVACERINKVLEGRPHIVDAIKNGEIAYIVNTTEGRQAIADSFSIRRSALQQHVTYSTTVAGAAALLHSLDFRGQGDVISLQELHAELDRREADTQGTVAVAV
jgi:carbamoyl-phosphate synthase large subunit